MAQSPRPDPSMIGGVVKPAFVRLPEPEALFVKRAQCLRALASSYDLRPYLLFLGDLCEAQYRIQDGLPATELASADELARVRAGAASIRS